jgi:hypothetical protein
MASPACAAGQPQPQLPATPLLMPCVDHRAHSYGRGQEHGGSGGKCRQKRQHVVGLPQQEGREHAGRGNAHAGARPRVAGRRQPGGQVGGEVGGERGQFGDAGS